jgi:hypothetical protein
LKRCIKRSGRPLWVGSASSSGREAVTGTARTPSCESNDRDSSHSRQSR